jgi:Uma2 family endonuclease
MSVLTAQYGVYRAEDLLLPGAPEKNVEIIQGELVRMTPADLFHNRISLRFIEMFAAYCASRKDLMYGSNNDGFLLRRNPDVLLSPDASLFKKRRLGKGPWLEFAPEVVVEVISPSNTPAEMLYKRHLYFEAGAEQFWMADPPKKALELFFPDGRRVVAQGAEILRGEGIVEGVEIDLVKLFEPLEV